MNSVILHITKPKGHEGKIYIILTNGRAKHSTSRSPRAKDIIYILGTLLNVSFFTNM